MINKDINDFVTTFVTELTAKLQQATKEQLHATLAGALGELPAARKSVPGDQRHYTRKPCPVPGCVHLGAPSYRQFCKEVHGPEFRAKGEQEFERLKAQYWSAATAPGGVWYKESKPVARRGRPPKAKTV